MVKRFVRTLLPYRLYGLLTRLKSESRVQLARYFHIRAIRKIRSKVRKGERIRVLFIDTETAKWKLQSLYEQMQNDIHYEPIVGVSRRDYSENKTTVELMHGISDALQFFANEGDNSSIIYDCERSEPINFDKLSPDIVFYEQPWYGPRCHNIWFVHRKALTCYEPYFVPNIGFPEFEAHMEFHRYLGYFFLLNKGWVNEYTKGVPKWFYSGKLVDVGHTMLDLIAQSDNTELEAKKRTVIYAPHHSLSSDSLMKIGTFLENGMEILHYAKNHREVNWVFRPHPVLKNVLQKLDGWGPTEQKRYYSEWAAIGLISDGGDYLDLFARSSVMITDCGSFLVEYAATGKPIIHLISKNADREPAMPTRKLISTYYKAHNIEELNKVLELVLVRGEDPMYKVRQAAVKEANLSGQNAAKNIMDFFDKKFRIKR